MVEYGLIVVLFIIGLWAVVWKRHLAKKIIGLSVMNSAVVILFVYGAAEDADTAPILGIGSGTVADPIPQALMLTAIVIGVSLTALALGLAYRLYLRYGTLDVKQIDRGMSGDE